MSAASDLTTSFQTFLGVFLMAVGVVFHIVVGVVLVVWALLSG